MKLFKGIFDLIKWLIGAALFFIVFLLCLIFIPGIFDEIIVAIIAVAAAMLNSSVLDYD